MQTRRARRLPWAALASLVLHGLLVVWWTLYPTPARLWARSEPIEIEIKEVQLPRAETQRPPLLAPSRPQVRPPTGRKEPRTQPQPSVEPVPPDAALEPPPDTHPPPEGNPPPSHPARPLVLTPSMSALPYVVAPNGEGVGPNGRTLHPDDPSLDPGYLREQRKRVAEARVIEFAEDDLAEARATRGLTHPYLSEVRGALAAHFTQTGSPKALGVNNALQGLAQNYLDTASAFGRSGNPGNSASAIPSQNEVLSQQFKNVPEALPLRMQAQARETLDALYARGPLFGLVLEVTQSRTGEVLTAKVVAPSGNRAFDAFVTKEAPEALKKAGPPPPEVFKHDTVRSVWRIEGWMSRAGDMGGNAFGSLLPSLQGVPVGQLANAIDQSQMRIDFRAKLMRFYP